jgi:putative hydrolases of HD superfamily
MQTGRLLKQLEFIHEIDKLKYIQRKTRLFNSNRHENDAEHSWHLAMMALVLAEHANANIDLLKVLKMVLIHDIVEIDTGDTFLFDVAKNHKNTNEEILAAQRIFGILPADQAEEMVAIWKEFEEGESPEARFAKTLDRLEPVLQNISNNGGTWTEFGIEVSKIYAKISPIEKGSDVIWQHTQYLIGESVRSGILKDSLEVNRVTHSI